MTNSRIASILLSLLLVSVALPGCETSKPAGAGPQETEKLRKENERLKNQIRYLYQRLSAEASRRSQTVKTRLEEVRIDNRPSLGENNARIAMVEFSDYLCVYCKRFHGETFELIKKNYVDTGKLLYVYHDYPRGSAKQAVEASVAANCAGEQGRFWEMQKIIFQRSPHLTRRFFKATAKTMGLDGIKYSRCLKSDLQHSAVTRDFEYSSTLNIRGTPTFFIGRTNGNKITSATRITGAQPYSNFASVIESYLSPTGNR